MSSTADEAAQARIIKHMNADHADSLSLYLQHFCHLTSYASRNAQVTSISLSAMTLQTTDGKIHTIPLKPAMTSFADARVRSVEMDREARAALGISHIRITEYERPRKPFHVFVFTICLFTFALFASRRYIVPGTSFYDVVLPWFPGGAHMFLKVVDKVALPTVIIHIAETWWLERSRLRKYGVQRGTGLWWKWVGSCLVEGFGTFARIDGTVKRKMVEAEKAKH